MFEPNLLVNTLLLSLNLYFVIATRIPIGLDGAVTDERNGADQGNGDLLRCQLDANRLPDEAGLGHAFKATMTLLIDEGKAPLTDSHCLEWGYRGGSPLRA